MHLLCLEVERIPKFRDNLNRRSAKLITVGELKISEAKPAAEMQSKNGTLKVFNFRIVS